VDNEAQQRDADVIVVGAGPVGMTMAVLLSRLGLSVVILEQQNSPSSTPKAISLDDESLRTYQAAGIVDRVLSIIVPGTGTMYYGGDGTPLFHARGPAPYRLGHPFKNPFAQPDLERVLREVIAEDPTIGLHYGARVIDVVQDPSSVQVEVESAGTRATFRGSYLVGADGGRSTVRERLGIAMTGRSYRETWLVVDTLEDDHQERFGMHHGAPTRPHVIVPGLDGRCRYEFLLRDGEGLAGEDPSFELMRKLLAPYRPLRRDQVERAVNYRFNALSADSWRHGRAFLSGDAAHMMPPFAGQGLNSGIRDVSNLAWKLAGVVEKRLAPEVLDSYESERKPHAEATIRLSERLGRIVMTTSPRLAAWRDAAIRDALATPEGREYLEEMRYRPIVRFDDGLVVSPKENPRVGKTVSQPRVFDTKSHQPRMLDDVLGCRWAIVGVDVSVGDWDSVAELKSRADAITVHVPTVDTLPRLHGKARVLVDLDGSLNQEFAAFAGCFLLLRPDRVVAAAWAPREISRVLDATSPWFESASIAAVSTVTPRRAFAQRAGAQK
jgi:3-(3-hydroxy-phenyl)propionate hydroxylase